jgi:hypothetical protein
MKSRPELDYLCKGDQPYETASQHHPPPHFRPDAAGRLHADRQRHKFSDGQPVGRRLTDAIPRRESIAVRRVVNRYRVAGRVGQSVGFRRQRFAIDVSQPQQIITDLKTGQPLMFGCPVFLFVKMNRSPRIFLQELASFINVANLLRFNKNHHIHLTLVFY